MIARMLVIATLVAPAIGSARRRRPTSSSAAGDWPPIFATPTPTASGPPRPASAARPISSARGRGRRVLLHSPDEAEAASTSSRTRCSARAISARPGEAGGAKDREIVFFDGATLVLRWVDETVAGRYGTMVFVRCRR